mmetsp:Transcript_14010/g.33883  ORF Transcript_14010/g.33883 Transcript_14010/m.33883 type:complete len:88 (-) Transcript_14010:496-759(-)
MDGLVWFGHVWSCVVIYLVRLLTHCLPHLFLFLHNNNNNRAQLENLGLHPYTSQVINSRADRLAAAFPQYNCLLIRQYSKSDPLVKR